MEPSIIPEIRWFQFIFSVFMRIEMAFQETEGLVSKWSRPGNSDQGTLDFFHLLLRSHNLKGSQSQKLDVCTPGLYQGIGHGPCHTV